MPSVWKERLPILVVVGIFLVPAAFVAWLLVPADEPPPEPEASLDCVPYEQPRSVKEINDFMQSRRSSPGFVGADVGASVRLSDGRTLWAFGDTLRPPEAPGPTLVRNSLMLVGDGCAAVYLPPGRGAAFPDRDDGVGYWPTTVSAIPTRQGADRVAVSLMRVRTTGSGPWDFEIVGSSVARLRVPSGGTPELLEVVDLGPDEADISAPLWGAAVHLTDEWVYIYGTANPGTPYVFGYSLHVARAKVGDYLDQETWEYWNGYAWSEDPDSAFRLVPAQDGVSRVLSVFERDGAWYAVSKRNEFVGSEMVIWKSSAPTGPFRPGPPVASIPSDDHILQYMPLAHPEVLPRKGSVVVSWSNNAVDPQRLKQDPTIYRPEFMRVPLP